MHDRIKELLAKAHLDVMEDKGVIDTNQVAEKFAELIVRECMKEAWAEIVDDEDIAAETDPQIKEYLIGQNQGIVDAVIRFRNHFGLKDE